MCVTRLPPCYSVPTSWSQGMPDLQEPRGLRHSSRIPVSSHDGYIHLSSGSRRSYDSSLAAPIVVLSQPGQRIRSPIQRSRYRRLPLHCIIRLMRAALRPLLRFPWQPGDVLFQAKHECLRYLWSKAWSATVFFSTASKARQ